MIQPQRKNPKRSIAGRVIICLLILLAAVGGFIGLKSMKKPPRKVVKVEHPLKVETISVSRRDVPVILSGHGELRSIRQLELAAEVAGRVVEVHPRLKTGEVISGGELLFAIDDIDYRTDYEINKERLAILKKDLALARKELARVKGLFDNNKVGTVAGVELAEKTVNISTDRLVQVRQAMTKAKIKLDRCRVTVPFASRIISAMIEVGQYVSPGKTVLSIADDSQLEVEVPVYGRDAVDWLLFESDEDSQAVNWFGTVVRVPVAISWTESPESVFKGYLHRVSSYSANTRSLKIVARLDGESVTNENFDFPLVAGMFVSVEIPGRIMEGVISLPRVAVSFENTVYVVRDSRLYTAPVKVIRVQGDQAFIGAGLEEGDQVVKTRLVNPLEGTKVQVVAMKGGSS